MARTVVEQTCLLKWVALINLIALCTACKPSKIMPPAAHESHRSQVVHQVEMEMEAPSTVSANSPVTIAINVTNHGDQPVSGTYVNGKSELNLRLADSEGRLPEGGKLGRFHNFGKAEVYAGSSGFYVIKPEETRTWVLELSKYFVFQPGEYSVSIAPIFRVDATRVEFNEKVYFQVEQSK